MVKRFLILFGIASALYGATENMVIDSKTHAVKKPATSSSAAADFDFTGRSVLGLAGGTGGGSPVPGPSGPPGPAGPPGPTGTAGPYGPSGPQGFDGPPGPPGPTGSPGPTGPPGPAGTSVVIKGSVANAAALPPTGNTVGDLYITLDTGHGWVWGTPGQWSDIGNIQGPAGSPGPQGIAGPQGSPGVNGTNGADGSPGPQGVPGPSGSPGAKGAQGPQGLTGTQGPQGVQGVAGAAGSPGLTGAQGPQGVKGDTGSQGIQGVAGPAGSVGPQGSVGPGVPTGGTAGQVLLKQSSTNFDTGFKSFGSTQSAPISTSGSSSTTAVMQGMAGSFTPLATGKAFLSVSGSVWNNTAAGLVNSVRLRYGTGVPPILGAAATGTAVGGFAARGPMTGATGFVPFCLNAVVTGLTPGTAYWLDVETIAASGGTVIVTNAAFACFEIP